MTLRLSSTNIVLATLAIGCSPSFEADLPDIEITQHALKVPGVPGAGMGCDVSIALSFAISACDGAFAKPMNAGVFVHQVRVAANGAQSSLDFIDSARLTVSAPRIGEGTTEIMNYDRSDEAQSGSVIDGHLPAPIDISTLWSASMTVIEIQLAGQLPEEDWSVDVTLNLSGKISYKL